ncbi:MAG: HD domain-containing protein [Clostridia bacterium]|nr:HD domain-containing protein [Clostridia bacterium]
MSKESKVVNFYVLCNKLKNVIRKGYLDWNVQLERIESVAEHVYGTEMLAIAMFSEFNYDIDLYKVILMLAIHELEETVIGDLTHFEISAEEKKERGHAAVTKILEPLKLGDYLEEIIFEFDERKTKEAIFAFYCDKMECDLQVKLYDEKHAVDLRNQENNSTASDEKVKKLLDSGMSWSEMWLKYDQERYGFDKNFMSLSNYILQNDISIK